MERMRIGLLVSVFGVLTAVGSPAQGQEGDDDEERVIEEMLVTAEPYQEQIADLPMAYSEFSAEERNLISADTARQMINLTPGVYLNDNGISIRGIGRGTPTTILGSVNSVALYVNGFYNVDPNTIAESTLFGGNVQFIRGPTGTRYGHNAIGGAVNLISRKPSEVFRGELIAGVGKGGWSNLGFTISGPITERYGYRLGVQRFSQEDSYQDNIGPVDSGFAVNNLYFDLQLEGDVTDRLHFLLRSTHFDYDNDPYYTAPETYNVGDGINFIGALVPNPQFGYQVPAPDEAHTHNVDFRGYDRLDDNMVHILNADYDFGPVTLYYVGGYAQYVSRGKADSDGTSRRSYIGNPPLFVIPGTEISTFQVSEYYNDNSYYSHELRLESNPSDDPIDWVFGAYYLKMDFDESFWLTLPDVAALESPVYNGIPGTGALGEPAPPNPKRAFFFQRNVYQPESRALFAHMNYDLTERWSLSAGVRYTETETEATSDFRYIFYYPPTTVLDVTPAVDSVTPSIDDSGVTARFGLTLWVGGQTEIYATYARGYKAPSLTLGDQVGGNATDSESLNAYELGVSHVFESLALTTHTNLFYYDYRNLQIPIGTLNPVTGGVAPSYVNAEESRMFGVELEAIWAPVYGLSLTANYTYLNAEFEEFCCAFDFTESSLGNQNLAGRPTPRAPEHKASLFGYYQMDFSPGSLILGGSVSYTGSMYSNAFGRPKYEIDGYTLVNGTLTWRAADDSYDVVASVTNAFDEEYVADISVAGANLDFARTEFLGGARFYSLTLRYRL